MTLIVCERTGVWAAAIRRAIGPSVRLRQTRGLTECGAELAAAPDGLVALELIEGNLDAVVDWIADVSQRFPHSTVLVLAAPRFAAYQGLVSEAGAIHMLTTPRELALLADVVRRRASRRPRQPGSLAEQVWAELPWGDAG